MEHYPELVRFGLLQQKAIIQAVAPGYEVYFRAHQVLRVQVLAHRWATVACIGRLSDGTYVCHNSALQSGKTVFGTFEEALATFAFTRPQLDAACLKAILPPDTHTL
jgi:hypothetical protein